MGSASNGIVARARIRLGTLIRQVPWPVVVAAALLGINTLATGAGDPEPDALPGTDPRVGVAAAAAGPRFVAESPVPEALIPMLRLPFPSGVVVQCTQGNNAAAGHTHSLPQNLHALDFANRTASEVAVVAAAAGEVAYTVESAIEDPGSGGGYGNQVRVRHEHGLYTLYSHLARVDVEVGDAVVAGQQLGTMGKTGLAGDRHLHFSLHHGVITARGVPPTIEIPALLVAEMSPRGSPDFAYLGSGDVRCSADGDPWSGAIYGSENDGGRPRPGPASEALALELEAAAARLREAAERRTRLWRFFLTPRTTPAEARRFLEPYLEQHPDEPVVQYAWAVEVEMPAENWREALASLAIAEHLVEAPHRYEPWIPGWVENQRGAIALARHRSAEAELHFSRAFALYDSPEVAEFARLKKERMALPTMGNP